MKVTTDIYRLRMLRMTWSCTVTPLSPFVTCRGTTLPLPVCLERAAGFWYRDLNSGAQDVVLFPLRCCCSVSPFTLTLSWPGGCFVWITAFLARRADVRIFVRDHMLEVLGASSNICTLWHAIYDILTRYRNMLIYAINGVSRNACAVLIERTCTVWMT